MKLELLHLILYVYKPTNDHRTDVENWMMMETMMAMMEMENKNCFLINMISLRESLYFVTLAVCSLGWIAFGYWLR